MIDPEPAHHKRLAGKQDARKFCRQYLCHGRKPPASRSALPKAPQAPQRRRPPRRLERLYAKPRQNARHQPRPAHALLEKSTFSKAPLFTKGGVDASRGRGGSLSDTENTKLTGPASSPAIRQLLPRLLLHRLRHRTRPHRPARPANRRRTIRAHYRGSPPRRVGHVPPRHCQSPRHLGRDPAPVPKATQPTIQRQGQCRKPKRITRVSGP